MTIQDFINEHNITMTSKRILARKDQGFRDAAWDKTASHFKVVLRYVPDNGSKPRTMATEYSMGSAYKEDPKLVKVLDSIRGDASFDGSFIDFCSELGYDEDSRKAEATFKACVKTRNQLGKLLGDVNAQQLMQCEGL
jgi:hypothetical protein